MSEIILNFDSLKTISCTVKKLTHSGFCRIDPGQIREMISICKINDKYVEHVFSRIFISLKENHSEVRLASVLLCDHFFNCFASFRTLLINNFDTYFKLTLGEKLSQNLPPPPEAAKMIIKTVIKNLNAWYLKYGKDYPKLVTTYNEFRNENCVDFENQEIYNRTERAKREKAAAESLRINKSLLRKACIEMKDMEVDINNSLTTMQTCFDILFEFSDIDKNDNSDMNSEDLRLNGVLKPYQNIEIEFNSEEIVEIKINDENSAVIDNAKEMFSLINKKYLPKVKAWSVLLSKVGGNEELSEKVLLLENRLVNTVVKFKNIKFIENLSDEDCVSTDSELEEVEEIVVIKEKHKIEVEEELFKDSHEKEKNRPSCSKTLDSFSERKKELLKVAPKVPYSSDLYHWEDGGVSTETLLPTATDGHRFWASSSVESIEVPAESANLRVIEFAGEFKPVIRACNAPLPSGKLCPRHDRVKCPFHGIIVPRDETGKIINKEDEKKVKKSKPIEVVPDWQDPKLLAELKAATGLDLKVGKKKRRNKNPGLTDIKKKISTVEKISKKIFKSSTLKKVNKTLDNLDYKRHRDKYGDQFNYVHGT